MREQCWETTRKTVNKQMANCGLQWPEGGNRDEILSANEHPRALN